MSNRKSTTTGWAKETVAPGIYKRHNGEQVAYYVEVRTKRGTARGTFPNRREAERFRTKTLEDMRHGRYFGSMPGAKLTVRQAFTAYCDEKQLEGSELQRAMYWANQFGDLPLVELDAMRVAQALDKLDAGRAGGTVNRYRAKCSAAWKWCSKAPRLWVNINANPVKPTEARADSKLRVVTLNRAERKALLIAVAEDGPALLAAYLMAIVSAGRYSEVAELTWDRVDLEQRTARLLDTKNGETRTLTYDKAAADALAMLRHGVNDLSSYVFPPRIRQKRLRHLAWKAAVERACTALGVKHIGPAGIGSLRWHDLRHVSIQVAVEAGATLVEACLHSGHKSFAALRRYAHLETEHQVKLAARIGERL